MYTTTKALLITKRIEVGKKKFAAIVLDLNDKICLVYVAFLASSNLSLEIHPSLKAQIASWKTDKAHTFILFKFAAFAKGFFKDLVVKF